MNRKRPILPILPYYLKNILNFNVPDVFCSYLNKVFLSLKLYLLFSKTVNVIIMYPDSVMTVIK